MKQQRAIFISRHAVNLLLEKHALSSTLIARARALERQATMCDALFPWPALALSLRNDADRLLKELES